MKLRRASMIPDFFEIPSTARSCDHATFLPRMIPLSSVPSPFPILCERQLENTTVTHTDGMRSPSSDSASSGPPCQRRVPHPPLASVATHLQTTQAPRIPSRPPTSAFNDPTSTHVTTPSAFLAHTAVPRRPSCRAAKMPRPRGVDTPAACNMRCQNTLISPPARACCSYCVHLFAFFAVR